MTRFAFVTWDGGGNLGPAVGIAQEMVARGHQVRFLGYLPQRSSIEARGFAFSPLPRSGDFDLYADRPADQRFAAMTRHVWVCREHLEDIPEVLAEHPADVLVVDFLMHGALAYARRVAIPVAVLAHSGVAALVPPPELPVGAARLAAVNELRSDARLPHLARLNEAWDDLLTLVTTIPELDPAAAGAAATVRYVGPITERVEATSWDSPWDPDDSRPLVVLSLSTTRLWDQTGRIRNTLAALGDEPVRLLISTPDPTTVGPLPANATARRYIPHALVMPWAALTVTHCGHGTISASLASGVPVLGLPNPAADQPFLAARLEQLGAGIALDGDSDPGLIRTAARRLLSEPGYRRAARGLAQAIRIAPGPGGAAAELEQLVHTRAAVQLNQGSVNGSSRIP
ncbi:MAG: glycosyltransferase [Candidatus Dormibacteraceae bacterium]